MIMVTNFNPIDSVQGISKTYIHLLVQWKDYRYLFVINRFKISTIITKGIAIEKSTA